MLAMIVKRSYLFTRTSSSFCFFVFDDGVEDKARFVGKRRLGVQVPPHAGIGSGYNWVGPFPPTKCC